MGLRLLSLTNCRTMSCSKSAVNVDIEDIHGSIHVKHFTMTHADVELLIEPIKELLAYFIENKAKIDPFNSTQKGEIIKKIITRKLKRSFRFSCIIFTYHHMIENNIIEEDDLFYFWLSINKKNSASGVIVVTLVMKPDAMSCPEKCSYCPTAPGITKSYLLDEPAVRRGHQHAWDAFAQFTTRLDSFYAQGQPISKIEIIIEGGTFGSYDKEYSKEFIRDIYYAANVFKVKKTTTQRERLSLAEEIKINESAKSRIIGLTIETRPDWVSKSEVIRFRELGVTRVQLGVQHINEDILNGVKRNCPMRKAINGIKLLKQNGFKVDLHFMPDLPGSSPEIDQAMFEFLFSLSNEGLQGDQLKIYPTMVTEYTDIKDWYEAGTYKPYVEIDGGIHMKNLLMWIMTHCPKWIRLNRIVRDFDPKDVVGGTNNVAWRGQLEQELRENKIQITDIKGREIGSNQSPPLKDLQIYVDTYRASDGTEYFISIENSNRTVLCGFVRLRISDDADSKVFFEALKEQLSFVSSTSMVMLSRKGSPTQRSKPNIVDSESYY